MDRIQNHPILGESPVGKSVTFTYDGRELTGYEGEPIAMALKVNGIMIHRYTAKRHEPRGSSATSGDARTVSWWWMVSRMSEPASPR